MLNSIKMLFYSSGSDPVPSAMQDIDNYDTIDLKQMDTVWVMYVSHQQSILFVFLQNLAGSIFIPVWNKRDN